MLLTKQADLVYHLLTRFLLPGNAVFSAAAILLIGLGLRVMALAVRRLVAGRTEEKLAFSTGCMFWLVNSPKFQPTILL